VRGRGQIRRILGNINYVMPDPAIPYREVPCRVRGRLRIQETGETTLTCVGDWVEFRYDPGKGELGLIERVLPRQSVLVRRSAGESIKADPIVANADQLAIVVAPAPDIRPGIVDRYLVGAYAGGLEVIVVVNKIDLPQTKKGLDLVQSIYGPLGTRVIATSALYGDGCMELFRLLSGRTTVLSGHSGVGKSTLINTLYGLRIRTREVREDMRGRHTTTHTEMHKVGNGTWVIDTPGIRSFGLVGVHPTELDDYFPDFGPYRGECRFSDCTHREEPGCAVREAVEAGAIAPSRYESYLEFFNELNEVLPEWERVR